MNTFDICRIQPADEVTDVRYMRIALGQARRAARKGEVPVGAVLVRNGQILSCGHNCRQARRSALGHAEIVAIDRANRALGDWRLVGATLYVTLEPCPMCMGAMLQARISRLVFGAVDPLYGSAGTVLNLAASVGANRPVEVLKGVCARECCALLEEFFRKLRNRSNET